jgi:two-component system, response regulator PdtaR
MRLITVKATGGTLIPFSRIGSRHSDNMTEPQERGIRLRVGQIMVILTAEDEFLISEYLRVVLEGAGHRVIVTYNADEAIEVLESRDDIELVITDIDMPGSMDGLRLAAAVREKWPPVKLIIVTGKAMPREEELPSGSLLVAKPYNPARVLSAVRHFR